MQAERILSMLALLISIVALVLSLVLKERYGEDGEFDGGVNKLCECPTYGKNRCNNNQICNCDGVGNGYGVCKNFIY